MIGIYKIVCLENGKEYIGSSMDIDNRWNSHKKDLNRGLHVNIYLQNDYNKFGLDKFEFKIVQNFKEINKEDLEKIEYELIEKHENCYNILGKIMEKDFHTKKRNEEINEILKDVKLTSKQEIVIDKFIEMCENKFKDVNRYVISGKPGTGKSFILLLMSKIATVYKYQWNACCFTGKGANVLRERGIENSSTIHGMMYAPILNSKGQLVGFDKRSSISYNLIFVDEFSMLDEKLITDIENYNIPVIYYGDIFQLPPIGSEKAYLEDFVDIEFDEIVRQAEGSPIIKWSNYVRDCNKIPYNISDNTEKGAFIVLSQKYDSDIIERLKLKSSQMIVGTNKLRNQLNKDYRKNKQLTGLLCEGEVITVLKNNQRKGVFNGQDFIIKSILSEEIKDDLGVRCMEVVLQDGDDVLKVMVSTECIHDYTKNPNSLYTKKKPVEYEEPIFIDYGYSKSCYKVQGSEYDSVLIFSSSMYWMTMPRDGKSVESAWKHFHKATYTSISRGKKKVYFVLP